MEKDMDLGETTELGIATEEMLGSGSQGMELSNPRIKAVGISDQD